MLKVLLPLLLLCHCVHAENEALQLLKAGNQRFIDNKMIVEDVIKARMKNMTEQKPYATILCCSDSRVPPEIVFDESLGRLFIVRVMGNVIGTETLATIEYGVATLKTPLLLVLGHENCGAVKAVFKGIEQFPQAIKDTLRSIIKPVDEAKRLSKNPEEQLHIAIVENARHQLNEAIRQSPLIKKAVENKTVETAVGVYCFETGKVVFIQ